MNITLRTVVLECRDMPQLLSFYQNLLGWPVVYEEETFIRIQSPDTKMEIGIQYDNAYTPPVWPTQPGRQQMMAHLDFDLPNRKSLKEAVEKALSLGAEMAAEQYGCGEWVTLLDPAGHPFCFVVWEQSA